MSNNGYGSDTSKVEMAIHLATDDFLLLEDNPAVFQIWRQLVSARKVAGKNVYDANLVTHALAHNASHIATLNERDFRRYSEIEILTI